MRGSIHKGVLLGGVVGCIVGILGLASVATGVFILNKQGRLGEARRWLARWQHTMGQVFAQGKEQKGFFNSFENTADLKMFQFQEGAWGELTQTHATHGGRALRLNIPDAGEYPGMVWEVYGSAVQDWSDDDVFFMDVFNNTERSVALNIKFKSGSGNNRASSLHTVGLPPLQARRIEIPLETIGKDCDLTAMSYVKVFVTHPEHEAVLDIDRMGTRLRESTASGAMDQEVLPASSVSLGLTPFVPESQETILIGVAPAWVKVFQDGRALPPAPELAQQVNLTAAQGEEESFQIIVRAPKNRSIHAVWVEPSQWSPMSEPTQKRPMPRWSWYALGYVKTERPYYPVKHIGYWPDYLAPEARQAIKENQVQPFWLTVTVPETTPAGVYEGYVAVIVADEDDAKGQVITRVPVRLRVYDFTLPRESHLKTAFDFYPHETYKQYHQREREPQQTYWGRLARINDLFMQMMLRYRMNPVLNVDPTNDEEMAMVDRYRVLGLNNFAVGKRGGSFNNNWPDSDEGLAALEETYRTYGEILALNRFLPYTYIYTWDEGEIGDPRVPKVAAMIHRAHKNLKNMVCYHGFWDPQQHPDWGQDIDIWTFQIDSFDQTKLDRLRERGMEMWMYVSGPGSKGSPNLAIDFDGIDPRIIPWLAWKYDISGFLYWCVNWWPYRNPFETAKNTKWDQNGNGLLFYPGPEGPWPSIRAELFRDGMEDYEYIQALWRRLQWMKTKGWDVVHKEYFEEGLRLLTVDDAIASSMFVFTKDGAVLEARRRAIAEHIERFKGLPEVEAFLDGKKE